MALYPIGPNRFADSFVEVRLDIRQLNECRTAVTHFWRSLGGDLEIQPVIQVTDTFKFDEYLIPCVSIHGNGWGNGKEPKGLALDGSPWVFDARRTAIPGCTLTENEAHYCALLASNDSPVSLRTSCSMEVLPDGHMVHRLLYPTIEEPLTYAGRDRYEADYQTYVHLTEKEEFTATALILSGCPVRRYFAIFDIQNELMDFLDEPFLPELSQEVLWDLSIQFAETLWYPYKGTGLFIIGHMLTPDGVRLRENFEIGWCGQNGMYAQMLIYDYIKTGNRRHLSMAMRCMDAWAQAVCMETGLPWIHYEDRGKKEAICDACNLSFYITQLLKCYEELQKLGIDRDIYRDAAIGTAEFLIGQCSREHGLGKAWRVSDGACVDADGTIGAYLIHPFAEVYRHTKDPRYLDAAKQLMDFYVKRDLQRFECTAGALDTCCIDKETSGALLLGGITLYEIEKEQRYLDEAVLAGAYFCSWMYLYDVPCEADSDFSVLHYRSIGGTAVSTQHHHIDPWGVLVVPSLHKLAVYTGDIRWRKRAEAMWFNGTQCITRHDGDRIHGLERPVGSQNEGFLQCRWGEAKETVPGTVNDWLVAWPAAFRMNTLVELKNLGKAPGCDEYF